MLSKRLRYQAHPNNKREVFREREREREGARQGGGGRGREGEGEGEKREECCVSGLRINMHHPIDLMDLRDETHMIASNRKPGNSL